MVCFDGGEEFGCLLSVVGVIGVDGVGGHGRCIYFDLCFCFTAHRPFKMLPADRQWTIYVRLSRIMTWRDFNDSLKDYTWRRLLPRVIVN